MVIQSRPKELNFYFNRPQNFFLTLLESFACHMLFSQEWFPKDGVFQRWIAFQEAFPFLCRTSKTLLEWPLVTSLTQAFLTRLLSLARQPALRRILMVLNLCWDLYLEKKIISEVYKRLGLYGFVSGLVCIQVCAMNLPQVDLNQADTSRKARQTARTCSIWSASARGLNTYLTRHTSKRADFCQGQQSVYDMQIRIHNHWIYFQNY